MDEQTAQSAVFEAVFLEHAYLFHVHPTFPYTVFAYIFIRTILLFTPSAIVIH